MEVLILTFPSTYYNIEDHIPFLLAESKNILVNIFDLVHLGIKQMFRLQFHTTLFWYGVQKTIWLLENIWGEFTFFFKYEIYIFC